jgi:hypothetical protein
MVLAAAEEKATMKRNRFPAGWDETRVQSVLEQYEQQTEDEALAEDEAAFRLRGQTVVVIPSRLVPEVTRLIEMRRTRHTGRCARRGPARTTGRWSPMGVSGDILAKERRLMSKVKDLESQIQELSPEELTALREWFTTFDAGAWDQEFEADVKSGKLDAMAERALRDHNAGRSAKL